MGNYCLLVFTGGIESFPGFLGGAGFCPFTVGDELFSGSFQLIAYRTSVGFCSPAKKKSFSILENRQQVKVLTSLDKMHQRNQQDSIESNQTNRRPPSSQSKTPVSRGRGSSSSTPSSWPMRHSLRRFYTQTIEKLEARFWACLLFRRPPI